LSLSRHRAVPVTRIHGVVTGSSPSITHSITKISRIHHGKSSRIIHAMRYLSDLQCPLQRYILVYIHNPHPHTPITSVTTYHPRPPPAGIPSSQTGVFICRGGCSGGGGGGGWELLERDREDLFDSVFGCHEDRRGGVGGDVTGEDGGIDDVLILLASERGGRGEGGDIRCYWCRRPWC